jgi:glycosyltransferase involved in cell wall biosynthesis
VSPPDAERAGEGLRVWLACDWFVKYTAGLAAGLSEVGGEVVLLCRGHDDEFGGETGAARRFVAARAGGRIRQLELPGRVSDPAALRDLGRVRRACTAWAPDVVHVQDSLANDMRLLLGSGVPPRRYALTVHDPVLHPGDEAPVRTTLAMRKLLRRSASLVFVHSEELRSELRQIGGTRCPIEVVPHGVSRSEPEPLPEQQSLLFFGRISHYKGLDVLLDAMPALWLRQPQLTLTVAGEGEVPDHPVLSDPRVRARFEHVSEAEVPGLFAAATCVVLPYRQASQSGVGSLARQFGRPVVATRVGGLPELVGRDWGRLVEPEDPEALATAVLELLETPGLAARMAVAAAGEADSDWDSVAASTVAAYRRHLLS